MIGYLQAADFTKRGRFVTALKYNIPYYGLYLIMFVAFVLFMYLSSVGKRIRQEGGGLVGVLMGINMTLALCQLALTMGYGVVRIPQTMFKTIKLQKRYEYAVYKVAEHEDEILNILYEKKNSLQTLIYISNNMNCEDSLKPYLDEMLEKVDEALEKTNE